MIEVDDFRKQYGKLTAVERISFQARSGEIFGLLGPNGAGKSTTINAISGLLVPTAGRIRVNGHDVRREPMAAKRALGVVPQELALYEELSARANLKFWAGLFGLDKNTAAERVESVLEAVGLADRADEPCGTFSGGMKRRLNFACAIVHQPRVLLLDEPTVGVDAHSREHLLARVREQARDGACVIYTTHYMEEAEALCDRVAIIDDGRIIAVGTVAELTAQVGERDVLTLDGHFPERDWQAVLDDGLEVEVAHAGSDQLRLVTPAASGKLPALFDKLAAAGARIRETALARPSLEGLFIQLTGKGLRE
ncbi:MAG: ABC transporter ATP-binding protein [Pseudomonadota bacterium]|nr:MAG: ABC transporter ATP-binding protein [Pseudomonadota bacterium]